MSHDVEYDDTTRSSSSALEESYWNTILSEGEHSYTAAPEITDDIIEEETPAPTPQSSVANPITDNQVTDSESDWERIAEIMDHDETLTLKVVGYNRGGLLVEWRSLRGFVPSSQLIDFPHDSPSNSRRYALVDHVGDTLKLRVIELDPYKNRLILSERAAQVESGARAEVLHTVSSGDIVEGVVTNLCDFGAFVDLGGVEGLVHISELSWGRVGHPADVLRRDQLIKAFVLDVNPDEARIALSMKRLSPDPWATVDQRYTIGEVVEGRITNVVDFGAFACIEEGLEGLIHFSELAEGQFLHPRNVVEEGDIVKARILSIDGQARRLGLSLRLI